MINCKDCRYWVENFDCATNGQCRINPPVYGDNIGNWPFTLSDSGCAQGIQKEGGWYSKEDDPRFRILKDMPVAHESNPLPKTQPNTKKMPNGDDKNRRLSRLAESMRETKEVLRKEFGKGESMRKVVHAAITFQRLHDGECGGLSESDLEVQLDEARDDLLGRVREYQK